MHSQRSGGDLGFRQHGIILYLYFSFECAMTASLLVHAYNIAILPFQVEESHDHSIF
jgi:hypothetical protein